MKKLFAIILGMAFMLSSFITRVEAISPDMQSLEAQESLIGSVEAKEVVDGKLTIELLKQMSPFRTAVTRMAKIKRTCML